MNVEQLSEEVEQISQIYAEIFHIERDANWFVLKLQEEVGELIQSYLMLIGKARAKSFCAQPGPPGASFQFSSFVRNAASCSESPGDCFFAW